MDTLPSRNCGARLQVSLVCFRLSPSCPFRLLHTFHSSRPARNYPRFWIRRSSFEHLRDLNPPEQNALLSAHYEPLRLPARTVPSVMYSLRPLGSGCPFPALPGLPGSSADRFLRAVPNHPGRPGECLLIASPPITGFILSGGLATFAKASRGRNGFACATARRFASPVSARLIAPPRSGSATCTNEQFYMVNSFQFTRSKPGLAWCTKDAKAQRNSAGWFTPP